MACYQLNDELTKKEIMSIENAIKNITLQYNTIEFPPEYKLIDFENLHEIICQFLDKYNIGYNVHFLPTWDPITIKIKKDEINKIKINRYANMFNDENITSNDETKINKVIKVANVANVPKVAKIANVTNVTNITNVTNVRNVTNIPNIINVPTIVDVANISNVRPSKYNCSTCEKGFKQKEHLNNHLKKKNKCQPIQQIIPKPVNPIVITENVINVIDVIKCDACNKTFTRKDNLNLHMKQTCKVIKQQNKDVENYKEEILQLEHTIKMLIHSVEIRDKFITSQDNIINDREKIIAKQDKFMDKWTKRISEEINFLRGKK